MTIARHYTMTAASGKGDALENALAALGDQVRAIAGCDGIELLRDPDNMDRFIFIEKWSSAEVHKTAGRHVDQDAMGKVMALLGAAPEGGTLHYIRII